MKNKSLEILIAIIAIVVVIIIVIILIILGIDNNNANTSNINILTEEQWGDAPISFEKKKLMNTTVFCTIEDCINNYFDLVEQGDTTKVYNLLDKEYISSNSITVANVLNYVDYLNDGDTFIAININESRNDNIYIYIVEGVKDDGEYLNNLYYIVKFDDNYLTYSITPLYANNYSNIEEISAINSETVIEANGFNKYTYNRIKDKDLLTKYMNYFIKLMESNPQKAYNMLDSEYKNSRFEDFNDFVDYINLTKKIYNQFYIQAYNVEKNNDSTEFIFNNTYNMYYKILATGPMEFTVLLDDYTIETEEFKTKYENADLQTRATTNVDKVMKMINSKDYSALYNLLDETYKANNFATIDSFIQYINTAFYNANYYTISNISEQGPYYLVTVTCKEKASTSANTKENRIIISLGEGTNFTMSFAIE